MVRKIFHPELLCKEKAMKFTEEGGPEGFETEIVPWLLFQGDNHFKAMNLNSKSKGYPNGYYKEGTIRFRPDKILLPLSERLFVFESLDFRSGKDPRGNIRIKEVVVSQLEELTDDEILKDGFEGRDDMLWQMTEMKGRYYKDLKPSSIISYFSFDTLNPFSGRGSDQMIAYSMKKQGEYWSRLKKMDKTGWTESIRLS